MTPSPTVDLDRAELPIERLKAEAARFRSEAALDEMAAKASNNPGVAAAFASCSETKRRRADGLDALLKRLIEAEERAARAEAQSARFNNRSLKHATRAELAEAALAKAEAERDALRAALAEQVQARMDAGNLTYTQARALISPAPGQDGGGS